MGQQNKWGGSFGKTGDSASGGSKVQGGNVYKAPTTSPQPMAKTGPSQNVIKMQTRPGDNMGTQAISTHNDINAFTRGIKSRGPYGGPSFSSLNHFEKMAKGSNTSAISSEFKTPSSGGVSSSRGTAGGSGRGMTKNSKVGSGSARATTRQSSPKGSNKDGSGYQASVK